MLLIINFKDVIINIITPKKESIFINKCDISNKYVIGKVSTIAIVP